LKDTNNNTTMRQYCTGCRCYLSRYAWGSKDLSIGLQTSRDPSLVLLFKAQNLNRGHSLGLTRCDRRRYEQWREKARLVSGD